MSSFKILHVNLKKLVADSLICSNFQFCLTFAIFKSLVRFSAKEYYVSNFMFIDLHSSPAMAAIFWYFLVTTIGPWLTVNFSDFPIQSHDSLHENSFVAQTLVDTLYKKKNRKPESPHHRKIQFNIFIPQLLREGKYSNWFIL